MSKEVLSLTKKVNAKKNPPCGISITAFSPLHLCSFNRSLQLISERFSPIFLSASSFSLNVPVGALETVYYISRSAHTEEGVCVLVVHVLLQAVSLRCNVNQRVSEVSRTH